MRAPFCAFWTRCLICRGTGRVECFECDGTGTAYKAAQVHGHLEWWDYACDACEGTGRLTERCDACYSGGVLDMV